MGYRVIGYSQSLSTLPSSNFGYARRAICKTCLSTWLVQEANIALAGTNFDFVELKVQLKKITSPTRSTRWVPRRGWCSAPRRVHPVWCNSWPRYRAPRRGRPSVYAIASRWSSCSRGRTDSPPSSVASSWEFSVPAPGHRYQSAFHRLFFRPWHRLQAWVFFHAIFADWCQQKQYYVNFFRLNANFYRKM